MSVDELEAFIAFLYVRGQYVGMNTPLESFWNEKYGAIFFPETLCPRNRYREIVRYLCKRDQTHAPGNRQIRPGIRCLGRVCTECVSSYKPGVNISVEEQWFPAKAKCTFTQYIPYKQDTWGMKFRLAADVDSKYVLNVFPYLGKGESQRPEIVVMRLVDLTLARVGM